MLGTAVSKQSGLASSVWLQQPAGFSTGDIKSLPVSVIPPKKQRVCLVTHLPREPKGLEQGVTPPEPPRGEGHPSHCTPAHSKSH